MMTIDHCVYCFFVQTVVLVRASKRLIINNGTILVVVLDFMGTCVCMYIYKYKYLKYGIYIYSFLNPQPLLQFAPDHYVWREWRTKHITATPALLPL